MIVGNESSRARVPVQDPSRVVFGGRSTEHQISCVSAGSIMGALDPAEFEVVPIGITRDGSGCSPTVTRPCWRSARTRALPEITAALRRAGGAARRPDRRGRARCVLDPPDGGSALADIDVVFPALHGAYGEDGTIQGLLEMAGIPYVGANVFASAAAMDKEFTKKLAAADGIPVGPYAVLRAGQSLTRGRQASGWGCRSSSSRPGPGRRFGITRVTDWDDLDAAVATARGHRPEGAGRGGDRRPRGRVRRAGGRVRRRARGVAAGRGTRRHAATTSTTSRRSTSTTRPSSTSRRTCPSEVDRPGPGAGAAHVHRAGLCRAGAGSTSSSRRRRRGLPQRDQHDARLHRDVDVPADVGGHGRRLPEAGDAPGPHRPAPWNRPALTTAAPPRRGRGRRLPRRGRLARPATAPARRGAARSR